MGKKWQEVDFFDVKVGDTVKLVKSGKEGHFVFKGMVSSIDLDDNSLLIGDFDTGKWVYRDSIEARDDLKFYRKIPPFAWPNKLGAVVSGVYEGKRERFVVVEVDEGKHNGDGPFPVMWAAVWGYTIHKSDLDFIEDLRVEFEGVDSSGD